MKYIESIPTFVDPNTGARIPQAATHITFSIPTAYFIDTSTDGIFDIDTEYAFMDMDNNAAYNTGESYIFNFANLATPLDGTVANVTALDYTKVTVTGMDGTIY